jgi:hypothetical protein
MRDVIGFYLSSQSEQDRPELIICGKKKPNVGKQGTSKEQTSTRRKGGTGGRKIQAQFLRYLLSSVLKPVSAISKPLC